MPAGALEWHLMKATISLPLAQSFGLPLDKNKHGFLLQNSPNTKTGRRGQALAEKKDLEEWGKGTRLWGLKRIEHEKKKEAQKQREQKRPKCDKCQRQRKIGD